MSNKFNVQVDTILVSLKSKLTEHFGTEKTVDRKTVLQLAKELGYLQGKQGRKGGTFATEMGMAFANLSGEIIKPAKAEKKVETPEAVVCAMAAPEQATVIAVTEVP